MKKAVVFVIVLMIIILVAIFFMYAWEKEGEKDDSTDQANGNLAAENKSGINQTKIDNKTNSEDKNASDGKTGGGGGAGGGGGGGSSGEGGSTGGGNEPDENTLPLDLYTAPCGFYFERYEICNGTCPSGSCFQEGRSCYCKIR